MKKLEGVEAYPLSWPVGYKQTTRPVRSQFQKTFAAARDEVLEELRKMKARNVVISSNVPLRRDGLPYSNYTLRDDERGIAVYFEWNDDQYVLACDKWNDIGGNMQAINKSIEAIRGLDRWGVSEMLKRAFTGFKALPENAGPSSQAWWEVLNVKPDSGFAEVETQYRKLAKLYHPDTGDDTGRIYSVNAAWNEARKHFELNGEC